MNSLARWTMSCARALGIAAAVGLSIKASAQDPLGLPPIVYGEISSDVRLALREAKLKPDEQLASAFARLASTQSLEFNDVYETTSKEVRVNRLAKYLTAKSSAKSARFGIADLVGNDIGDFHWGYMKSELVYSPTKIVGTAPLHSMHLRSVEVAGTKYAFDSAWSYSLADTPFVLPAPADPAEPPVTVRVGGMSVGAVWTGRAKAGVVDLPAAASTQGAEIHVGSDPPGALVYFNGKPWHRRTNTRSVHTPGTYEVTIRRSGYKEWRQRQDVVVGAPWVIQATLEKIPQSSSKP